MKKNTLTQRKVENRNEVGLQVPCLPGKSGFPRERNSASFLFSTETKKIFLSKGKYALVDADLFEELNKVKWSLVTSGRSSYAMRQEKQKDGSYKAIKMHRLIMGRPKNKFEVDHIDSDGLNNQRKNLRLATKNQNQFNRRRNVNNTTGFKGVHQSRSGAFQARAQVNGKRINLGFFKTKSGAGRAYAEYVKENHGIFARTK